MLNDFFPIFHCFFNLMQSNEKHFGTFFLKNRQMTFYHINLSQKSKVER